MHRHHFQEQVLVTMLMLMGNCTLMLASHSPRIPQKHRILTAPHILARADELESHFSQKISDTDKSLASSIQMLAQVIARCEEKSFRAVDFKKFLEEAVIAAAPLIDSHSAFYNQEAYKNMLESTSGKFFGIGVTLTGKLPDDETLTVIEVLDDGPAANATQINASGLEVKNGLCAGDEIVEINNTKLRGLSSDECIAKLKGPKGSTVSLKIIRKKKMLEYVVTRDEVKHPVVQCYQLTNQKVWYLSLKLFTDNAAVALKPLLERALADKARGIIIDMRRNPGGVLDVAVDIAGLFVPRDSLIVSTKDRSGKTLSTFRTSTEPLAINGTPIIVLVDNFSASASEILAGALRYYSNQMGLDSLPVFVIGTQTFGKGSVQEVIPISNGCALKLTVMLYYLPDGTSIQATGIMPDITVDAQYAPRDEERLATEFQGSERSLRHHITREEVACIEGGKPLPERCITPEKNTTAAERPVKTPAQRRIKSLCEDNQIHAALTILNMYNFARTNVPAQMPTRNAAVSLLSSFYVTEPMIVAKEVVVSEPASP